MTEKVLGARFVEKDGEEGIWTYQEYDLIADKYFDVFDFQPRPNESQELLEEPCSLVAMMDIIDSNFEEIKESEQL